MCKRYFLDLGTRETKFTIGEEFTRGYGRNMDDGIMYVTVTKPEPHIIMFNAEERMKGWRFETNYTFSPLGKVIYTYTRSRLYGHRIYGLFGYLVNFWVVPISSNILKLTIYPEFDLNFGYMVNF